MRLLLFILFVFILRDARADDSTSLCRKRKIIAGTVIGGAGVSSLTYLATVWYKPYSTGRFHFFNDNDEWLQMDKAGHLYSSYQTSRLVMDAAEWACADRKQKIIAGSAFAAGYLTVIEVLDGFSSGWGFSWTDEAANIGGTAISALQEGIWNEQRLLLKFSYQPTSYAAQNPKLLGNTPESRLLKDYNGQTYWLSFSPNVLFGIKNRFPGWLNLAIGYGATGMTGARYDSGDPLTAPLLPRSRQIFLSLDLDLCRIKTRSKFLRSLFSVVNILKIPAPAVGFNNQGAVFCWIK
jgi:hypothetical protein